MDRSEAAGLGVSVAGHAALLAALAVGLSTAISPPPMPDAMEVSFVDDVGLTAAAPVPSTAPAAPARAPEVGPAEDAAAAPRQTILAPLITPTPAPAAGSGTAQANRRPGLGDLDPRSFGREADENAATPPAAVMSAQAAADIGSAIKRQVQPCADRQVYPGPGAERIVTAINLRLNRDGSLAARPRVMGQSGLDDENRRYADRVADLAIATFSGCAPLRGLPQELYDVQRGWSNFTMNYRLPG